MSQEVSGRLADEAASLALLLRADLVRWEQVIVWADAWITKLNQLPDSLIEISLNKDNVRDGLGKLDLLSEKAIVKNRILHLRPYLKNKFDSGEMSDIELYQTLWDHCLSRDGFPDASSALGAELRIMEHYYDEANFEFPVGGYMLGAHQRFKDEIVKFLNTEY